MAPHATALKSGGGGGREGKEREYEIGTHIHIFHYNLPTPEEVSFLAAAGDNTNRKNKVNRVVKSRAFMVLPVRASASSIESNVYNKLSTNDGFKWQKFHGPHLGLLSAVEDS